MQEAGTIYQKTHPGFTLNIVETPWADLQTKLSAIAQSGQLDQLPDIFLMQNNAYQKNVTNYPDLFADFGDSGVDFNQYPESVVGFSTVEGRHYGLPFDNATAVAAYRTDILEQAGFTIDDFTDLTWAEFMAKGREVLAKTGKPLLSGLAGDSDTIALMLRSAGGSLFDKDGKPTIVNNDILREVIAEYKEMVSAGVFLEVNSRDEYAKSFVTGQVAAVIQGCWVLGTLQSAEDQAGKWDLTNVPKLNNIASATNYASNGGSSWAVSSTGNYELATDFLKSTFAGSMELYDTILPGAGALAYWMPAGKSSVYSQPQPFFSGDKIYSKIVDFSQKVPNNNPGAYFYEAREAISAAMTKMLNGTDVASALQEAQDTVEFAMH
jgi:lactose/L-arabinose transport system substrate-binding protein